MSPPDAAADHPEIDDDPVVAAAAAAVVGAAPVVTTVVDARRWPHATPQLCTVAHGRVWIVTPRAAAKVRVLRRRPDVVLVARDGDGRSAVLRGIADVIDPLRPFELATKLPEAVLSALAVPQVALQRPAAVAEVVRDALKGPIPLPGPRVVVAVRPTAALLIEADGSVDHYGDTTTAAGAPVAVRSGAVTSVDLRDLPPAVRPLLDGAAGMVTVAARTSAGTVAAPGRWDVADHAVRLPHAVAAAAGFAPLDGAAVAGAVCLDAGDGTPSGVLVRGRTEVEWGDDDVRLSVAPERVTWWEGADVATVSSASGGGR